MTKPKFTYHDLLKCAERELKFRYRVYERKVDREEMTRAFADREIAMMEEIAAVLRALAEHELLPLAPVVQPLPFGPPRLVHDTAIADPCDRSPPARAGSPRSEPDGESA